MEHFNSILFHKSGPANKQHTYQSIIYKASCILPYRLHSTIALPTNWKFASRGKRTQWWNTSTVFSSTSPDLLTCSIPINQSYTEWVPMPYVDVVSCVGFGGGPCTALSMARQLFTSAWSLCFTSTVFPCRTSVVFYYLFGRNFLILPCSISPIVMWARWKFLAKHTTDVKLGTSDRDQDRSWFRRHTSVKLFLSQPMAPLTSATVYSTLSLGYRVRDFRLDKQPQTLKNRLLSRI